MLPAQPEQTSDLLVQEQKQVLDDPRESVEQMEQPDDGGDLTEAFRAVAPAIDLGSDSETTDSGSASPAPEKVDFAWDNADVDAALVALRNTLGWDSKTRVPTSDLMPHFVNFDKTKFRNAKRRITRADSANSGPEKISKRERQL